MAIELLVALGLILGAAIGLKKAREDDSRQKAPVKVSKRRD